MATGVNVGNAYINVRADSKYIKGDMAKAQTAFTTSFKRIALAATAAATAATYALSKIGKEAISVATKYETALVDMGKVTNQSFDVIKKAVESLDPVLGTSTELMKGYYQVISAGVTEPKAALELLTTASKLAKTAHVDQAEAIKGLTKIMAGYGDELKTTSDAADLLFAIEKEGQTSVAELIPLIGGLATISKEAGVTANEMGAALATLSKVFGSTSEAATSYQGILAALQRGNADLTIAWEKLGVSGSKAAIKAWGFAGTLQKLKEYSESSGTEMIKLIGRVEATTGALVIAADGAKAFNTTMVNLQDRAGKAEEAFKRWTKTTEAFVQVWKSVKEKVLVIIGDALIPVLKDVITQMAYWVKANEDLIKQKVPEYIDKVKNAIEGIIGAYNSLPAGITGAAFGGIIGRILTGSTPIGLAVGALILLNEQLAKIGVGSWGSMKESFQDLNEIIDATIAGERWEGLAGNVNKVTMKIDDTRDATDSWLEKMKAFPEATKEVTKGFDEVKKTVVDTVKAIETTTAEGFESWAALGDDYSTRFMQMERGLVNIHGVALDDRYKAEVIYWQSVSALGADFESYFMRMERGLIDTTKEANAKKVKTYKEFSSDVIETLNSLYNDMKRMTKESYAYELALNDKKAKEYKKFLDEKYVDTQEYADLVKGIDGWLADANEKSYIKMLKNSENFFDVLKGYRLEDQNDWISWGNYMAVSANDMFKEIGNSFRSNISDFITGEISSLSDFWDAILDDMLSSFADWVAKILVEWAKTKILGWLGDLVGLTDSGGGGGDSIATTILGKIASYIGDKTGITSYFSGLLGTGATTGTATIGSLQGIAGGPAAYQSAIGGYAGAYQVGGYGTQSIGALQNLGNLTPAEYQSMLGSFSYGTAIQSGYAAGGAVSSASQLASGIQLGQATGEMWAVGGAQAAQQGATTGAGAGAAGAVAGFAAMAISALINIEDMRKRRSMLEDMKQQFDDYYATLESSEQAAATFSESQTSMFELVGDASAGYFLAQAVSLKASAGEYEELAKIHGESVEAVTARYENLGEAMKDFGYHVDEFGRVATSLEAGELIQEALWGTETAVSEANILKLTLEWDVGNLDEISAAALKTTNDLKTITEGPSATMDMDEYYDAAVASAERYIDNMKSKMQDLSTSEQDYVTAMLEVWTDSTNSRTTMSQTFFDSAEESYRALTEVEQAWVLTALSDYESLTTEGTATAQAFYESQVNSYNMLTEAEQAWAQSALGTITEYYEGATALSSSFLEKYRGDYETSLSVINEYADNSLSTIQEYLGSLYPELAELYENGTGYFESATTAAEDAINSLVETGIAAAEEMTDTVSDSFTTMADSSSDSLTNALAEMTTGFEDLESSGVDVITSLDDSVADFSDSASSGLSDMAQGFGITLEEVTDSMTDSIDIASNTFITLADTVDSWSPSSKVVDILYKYSSEGGDIPGFQHGGVASGPMSGYPVILHGTERITPVSGGGHGDSGGSGPLNLNLVLELDGKTLEYKIKSVSDGVRVSALKREVGENRIYN